MSELYNISGGGVIKQDIINRDVLEYVGYNEPSFKALKKQSQLKDLLEYAYMVAVFIGVFSILFGTTAWLDLSFIKLILTLVAAFTFLFAAMYFGSNKGAEIISLSLIDYAKENELALRKYGEEFLLFTEGQEAVVDSVSVLTSDNSKWVAKNEIGLLVYYKKDSQYFCLRIKISLENEGILSDLKPRHYEKLTASAASTMNIKK